MSQIQLENIWNRRGTLTHARRLLGLYLTREHEGRKISRMVTDVEAYDGERDQACHARFGRTARSAVLYRPGGVWYVYLCYGIHEMLNLVVGPEDWPAALLIRGVDGADGPGRVTRAIGIDRRYNGLSVTRKAGLYLEDRGFKVTPSMIIRHPRVGIDYAGPVWAAKPWRFTLKRPALGRF